MSNLLHQIYLCVNTVALEVTLPAELLREIAVGLSKRELGRTTPANISSGANYAPLQEAAAARAKSIAPESSDLLINNKEYVPEKGKPLDTSAAASVARGKLKDGREFHQVRINPNVDASYYAHELGHAVSQKNKVGRFVNESKRKLERNPALRGALKYAVMGGLAGTAGALQEGDDDLVESIALAAALGSPTLIDEALASKNALAIMNDAGLKANMAQRGRLAGAYLSYLAPVIIAGSVGNSFGNMADDYTALYDL